MVAEMLDTSKGRIVAHLLCLGRSLRQGRLGSLGFYYAGIRRTFKTMMRESWQPQYRMHIAK